MLSLFFGDNQIPSFIKVTDISESLIPSFAATKFKTTFSKRIITIDYEVERNKFLTRSEKIEFLNFIKGNNFNISKLILPGGLDRYYMAKVTNASDINGEIYKGEGSIEFTCFDYREYEATKTTAKASNNILKVNYLGTEDVYPVIKINVKSNCSKIKVNFSNGSSTNFLEFNDNFKAGDILILDQAINKLTVNGINNPSIWHLNSKRNKLINGLNTYTVESGNIDFTIEFNTAYL